MDGRDVEDALFRFDGHFLELSEQVLAESPSARLHLLRAAAGRIFGIAIDPVAEGMCLAPTAWVARAS